MHACVRVLNVRLLDPERSILNQIKDLSRLKNFSSQALLRADALAKLLIEKGLITREEFMRKISGRG